MKQIKNSFNFLSRLSNHFTLLISLAILLPPLLLCFLGIWFIYAEGYILHFVVSLIFLSLIVYSSAILVKYYEKAGVKDVLEDEIIIDRSPQWSEFDNNVYDKLEQLIDEKLKNNMGWGELQVHSLEILSQAAEEYYPDNTEKELAFSISEFLLAVEEVSCRYRGYIKMYIPFEDRIKVSLLKQGYTHKDKLGIVEHVYDVYRGIRILNPAVAFVSEVRGRLISSLFENVANNIQNKMKKALLQDVASVSIDLYRGHFKVKDSELSESKTSKEDKNNQADTVEPLRVTVVGQINAGKSSVINAITEKMVAEVSILPSTDNITVYDCNIDGIDAIKFIDLPGLNGSQEIEQLTIKQMTESDLIFWVLKADSTRAKDSQLKTQFDVFYTKDENLKRKKPSILALVNQVDKLQPIEEWNPPYDIINCKSSDKKACIIRDVVKFNQEILQPDNILPLSLNPNLKFYNLEAVKEYLQTAYNNGINTQLNRRRIEDVNDGFVKSVKKIAKGTSKLFF